MEHIAILGTTPQLSALELERLGWLQEWKGGFIAKTHAEADMNTLGGVIKLAEVVTEIPRSLEGIEELELILNEECKRSSEVDNTKVRFGFSVYPAEYGIDEAVAKHYAKKLKKIAITWKKAAKQANPSVPIRYVESQEAALSSVIVDKEKLLPTKTDFIVAIFKKHIVLARTTSVQPYKDFSKRDYGRPERDHKSGMLPPKVARMMLNIANPDANDLVVDPFCGSGTVIQEALLLGHINVAGSDSSTKAIEDAVKNINWLIAHIEKTTENTLPQPELQECDVRNLDTVYSRSSISCIVAEGFLGPTRPKKTDKVHRQMKKLYMDTFEKLPKVLTRGARVVLAVPAWQRYDRLQTLDIETAIAKLGFKAFHEPIIYGREHAKVVRQILFLEYQP